MPPAPHSAELKSSCRLRRFAGLFDFNGTRRPRRRRRQRHAHLVDVLFATRPTLPPEFRTNVPLLRRAAWDTALSTGALRLVHYDLAAGLSEIYGMQEYAGATFPKLFSSPSLFDPAGRAATIRLAQTTMREWVFAEETLLALYDRHLPVIRSESDAR
jgi:hypothetical protein